ncbi:MAG: hypothetical protein ACI9GO_000146 [Bacteroidia bacterium]
MQVILKNIIKIITVGFTAYVIFYFIALFAHLELIPLAWIDEIMGLDPALRYLSGKGLTSRIWPQEGTSRYFMAYLPLQTWFHILHLKILPFSIYWVRFPWAVYLMIGTLLVYLGLKKNQLPTWIALGLCILLINDKSLFETTRAVRVEPLIFLLFSIAFYAKAMSRHHLQSIAASLLFLCHPDVWPLSLILFLDACSIKNTDSALLKPNRLWLYPLLTVTAFLWSIEFNIPMWLGQLIHQGSEHSASGNIFDRLHSHFILRFWPYYTTQPWTPLIIYASFIGSLTEVFRKKISSKNITILLTHLIWFVILGPFHRYNCILLILAIWWSIPYLKKGSHLFYKTGIQVAFMLFVIFSSADVVARHHMAHARHVERNPYPVIRWLKEALPDEDYLLSGHAIGYYAMNHKAHNGYILANIPPYDYNFEEYSSYYIVQESPLKGLKTVSTYRTPVMNSFNFNSKTYETLYLMRADNKEKYLKTLQEMDVASRKEVSNR